MAAFTAQASDPAVPLALVVNRLNQGGVAGLAPTVAVRLARDPTLYLDFDDDAFKAAGWGTRDAALAEIRRGHYQRELDVVALVNAGLAPTEILVAEYHVDAPVLKADGQDIIVLELAASFGQIVASGQDPAKDC